MSTTDSSLQDPLTRFRNSMGSSATEVVGAPQWAVGRPPVSVSNSTPDPEHHHDEDDNDDGTQLLKLVDEALAGTHDATTHGASFVVTASASQTSFTAVPTHLFGSTTVPPATPPTFAETIAAQRVTPAAAAVPQPTTPPPFGMMVSSIHQASGSSPPPPPPPPVAAPLEHMIVRNHRGVFLLNPVGKASGHPGTPSYAPPQYSGTSPPISPLPSYTLPPPVPPMAHLSTSVQSSGAGGQTPQRGGVGQSPPNYPTPHKSLGGQSPPNYHAPPPYRSPSGKGDALAGKN